MFAEHVLLKKGLRNDSLWTIHFSYRLFRRIPFFFDMHVLLKSQYWPRARIETITRKRIAALIRDSNMVPFWRDVFSRSGVDPYVFAADDLSKLPITSKKNRLDRDVGYITNERYINGSFWDRTSGSTGMPFRFYQDRGYVLRMYALCERMLRTAGGGRRFPVISMRARERQGFAFTSYAFFFIGGYNFIRHRFKDFVALASSHKKGFILYGFVSPLLELARVMREKNIFLPIRGVIATGEELLPEARGVMAEAFGANIYTCYPAQELGWLAFECEHHKLHINEESYLVEIIDIQGHSTPAGDEGRVVVTAFEQRVMPFIRYFTGDLGTIDTTPCTCGRTLRTMRLKGREAHMIELTRGRKVPLLELASVFDRFFQSIRQYQIVHTAPLAFTVKVIPGKLYDEQKAAMERALMEKMLPTVRITWEIVDDIPPAASGKAVYFVRTF